MPSLYLIAPGVEVTANYTLLERTTSTGQRQVGLGNVRNSAFLKLGWYPTLRLGTWRLPLRANVRGLVRGREPLTTTTALDQPVDPWRIGQTQFIGAYQTWDGLIGCTLPFRDGAVRFEPYVNIRNLGDFVPRGYVYADGASVRNQSADSSLPVFREPGRRWRAGFQIRFGK